MKRLLYNGKNLKEYLKEKGVKYDLVQHAMHLKCMNLDEAIEYARHTQKYGWHARFYYEGLTLRQYCIKHKLKYATIYGRLMRGMSIEDAVRH